METNVEQQSARSVDADRPQILALRVEHDEDSLSRFRFVGCHSDNVDVAIGTDADPLGVRLTRRQRGKALHLTAVERVYCYRHR
jgi:hypothetical protein